MTTFRRSADAAGPRKGRGAASNPENRFAAHRREFVDDGWAPVDEAFEPAPLRTHVTPEIAKSILSRNDSPDIPFTFSINPYHGCEHGCIYCYARPSYAYLDLSPGLDFETRLFAKVNAAELLREALRKPGHRCEAIALGANTDAYQPVERDFRITRSLLEVLDACHHPVTIVTKNALVLRDLDILGRLAARNLVHVFISVTTLDHEVARRMEPRASSPTRRIETLQALKEACVPCGVMVAAIVPFLTDHETEAILERAAGAGATRAAYVLLRLPLEIDVLFCEWLGHNFPLKADHVMGRVRAMRDGRAYDPTFGTRMRGEGLFADLLAQRFGKARDRLGLNRDRRGLDSTRFRPPGPAGQLDLF
jgi:DNA repair photolyase